MSNNVLQSDLESQTNSLATQVFPNATRPLANAANTLLNGLVKGGSTLVTDIAAYVGDARAQSGEPRETMPKGLCERVSRWLEDYDFATPAAQWLLARNAPRVDNDTTLAADLSDLSKPFGGKGMEGMARGRDASRKSIAWGHTFGAVAAVAPSRQHVFPLCFAFGKGRKGENERIEEPVRAVSKATNGKGTFALDRGSDSERALTFLQTLPNRAVVRVKELQRDVFGNGKKIDAQLDAEPRVDARLFKSSGPVEAKISWRAGRLSELHDTPMLLVRSEFDGRALYLYVIPGKEDIQHKLLEKNPKRLAVAAAQAYLDRWQIETFFERVKQDFSLEDARVRTFKRLSNLFHLCVLGYSFITDFLPSSAVHTRMLKVFKDNSHRLAFRMQTFLSGLRTLLERPRLNFIAGRPRRRVFVPDVQMALAL